MPEIFIKYNGLNVYKAGGLTFMPGNNRVDQGAWEKAKAELPLVRHRVANDLLVEAGPATTAPADGEGGEAPVEGPLAGNQKNAVAFIKDTFDKELLEKLQAEETAGQGRKGVLEAIAKQLDTIDPSKKID